MNSVDHLVVLAPSLAEGVAWCEATLGVVPGPGGEHPLMGTHNRLIPVNTAAFPRAYLEIIAINREAVPQRAAGAKRWFDLDDDALQARLRTQGPQLAHWVAEVPDLPQALATLSAQGIDRGQVVAASRPTPQGLLRWQISVRDDGQRLLGGCLPTLIQWGDTHPTQGMADQGVALESLALAHPQAGALRQALDAVGLGAIPVHTGPARLQARLRTPRGPVDLIS
jgi:hypothetical protein